MPYIETILFVGEFMKKVKHMQTNKRKTRQYCNIKLFVAYCQVFWFDMSCIYLILHLRYMNILA